MSPSRTASRVASVLALALPLLAACGGDDTAGGTSAESSASGVDDSCTPAHPGLTTVEPGVLTAAAFVSPPYTEEEGDQITGIDGAIVEQIAKLECLELVTQSVAGAALPSTVQSGRADVAIGGVYYSEDRAKSFSLTRPMYRDGLSLLSRDGVDSLEGLSGKTLGVIQGYLWNEEFQQALGVDNVKTYQSSASLISDIKNGRVDAGAFTSAEADYRAKADTSLMSAPFATTPEVASSQAENDVVLLLNQSATDLTKALDEDITTMLADGSIEKALTANGVSGSLAAAD